MLMYQQNEDLYSDFDGDGVLDGMQINIDSKKLLDCFEELVTLFQTYKFPRVYDLATYFRMGEMPIAVADYLTYNQFTIYATELRGLWEFTLLPGTVVRDENGNIQYDEDGKVKVNSNAPCSVSATVLMKSGRGGRDEKLLNNCWEFMKWWTDAEAQSSYAKQYEAIIGMAAKFNTANKYALRNMSWTNQEWKNLEAQFKNLKGTPEFPGGYIIIRYVDFAFLNCYNNNADAADSLLDQIQYINNELTRKRKEFGLKTYEEYREQHEEIFNDLKKLLIDELGVSEKLITLEAQLKDKLGIDAQKTSDLISLLKAKYEIEIDGNEIRESITVNDVVEYLYKNVPKYQK